MTKGMKKLVVAMVILGILTGFCFGMAINRETIEVLYVDRPVPEYVEIYRTVPIEKMVFVEKVVRGFELREFANPGELSKWLARNYLGEHEDWNCVNYALETQRLALVDGYQMSTECLIDKGGKTGHMINSTIIGDRVIFADPQTGRSWVGGIKGKIKLKYEPILKVYDQSGKLVKEVYLE